MSDIPLRDFLDNARREAPATPAPDGRVRRFHRSIPGYEATPLVEAPATAAQLGLASLHVKLETERFGLPAFKILGASWAVCRALSRHAGREEPAASFAELRELVSPVDPPELVCATDGNHGRAVAHMAALLGLEAHILVPAHTAAARIDAIAGEGATVDVVDGSYDDAIAASIALADERRLVISDHSWEGYEDVPGWVADGYQTIFDEIAEQLEPIPPLFAIQIGVGALAAAAVRALAAPGRVIVGVEPAEAACVLEAVRVGEPVALPGPQESIMAGLNCGTASPVALPDMATGIAAFCAIDDRAAEDAVRALHGDGLDCGETGAAGVAGLLALRERWPEGTWERLGADAAPAALVLCTEAPTDPVSFARIIGR
ncbi:MAG: diaminopropionate ammonia-lyase [Solirubrobacteraceae bacterium]|jgi:diaminopropionate ammonia-lyase|nr:diaminopropionate ammonia-lyase [Solirubrobacteraceae bacterium]